MDRLEELLALLEEEEGEEQEDAAEPGPGAAIPAAPIPGAGAEAGPEDGPGETAPAKAESGPEKAAAARTREERPAQAEDGRGEAAEGGGTEAPGEAPEEDRLEEAGGLATVLGTDGQAVSVPRPNGAETPGTPGREAAPPSERSGPDTAGHASRADAAAEAMPAAERGLEGLYRQAVQAARPAVQNWPVEQAGRTVRAEEPGRTAALTVDELDRAVRRDSRRYDGGMSIF